MSERGEVIITGGAGFIGSHLAQRLVADGRRVVLIDDLSTGREANIAQLMGERCALVKTKVSDAVRARPDVFEGAAAIYHLAASVGVQLVADDPAAVIRNNIDETAAVFDAAARCGARVLLTSTSEVYGKAVRLPLREDADLLYGPTTQPRWSYALSKAVDEQIALNHRIANLPGAVVVRLFNTIGPRQVGRYGMVVPRFIDAAVRGETLTIHGDGEQTRCFCDVRDVADAMIALMADESHAGQVFNIGSDEELSINALADRVIELCGSSSPKQHVPCAQVYGQGFEDPFQRRVPDLTKVRQAIGFKPRYTLDQTLRELIDIARDTNA